MHRLPFLLFLLGSERSLVCTRPLQWEMEKKLIPIWSFASGPWGHTSGKTIWFIPLVSLQSIYGMGILAALHLFKSGLPCWEGRQPLHPLSCCKDELKQSLEAKCVLCTLQPDSLAEKLDVRSERLSYVRATFVSTVGRYQDMFYEDKGHQPKKVITLKGPLISRWLCEVEL